jgi:hypothetical protein
MPSLITLSKEKDLASNTALLSNTELGMEFSTAPDRLMHTHMSMPTIIHGPDTIGYLHYNRTASRDFTTEPVDTLARTVSGTLADGDAVVYTLNVTCFKVAADTLIIESFLYDPGKITVVASSGEMKIPPRTGDTTLIVGLEAPNGFPPTDCVVTTSMRRGYFGGGSQPEIALVRYTLFDNTPLPKERIREGAVVIHDHALQLWPQPAQGTMHISVDGSRDGMATLYDLLGREVRETQLSGNGNTARGEMKLGSISPGIYMLVARTSDAVHTGKVVVAR